MDEALAAFAVELDRYAQSWDRASEAFRKLRLAMEPWLYDLYTEGRPVSFLP
jgi:hypothetical protein